MDYVDVYYAHGYDGNTPILEICQAFHDVIEDGHAFYWATSNWDCDQVFQAFQVCEKYNLHKPVLAQNHYNMLARNEMEGDYWKLFEKYNYGLAAFSVLEGGLLTGKYLKTEEVPEGSRLSKNPKDLGGASSNYVQKMHVSNYDAEDVKKKLAELQVLSEKELNCSLAQLAIAWVLKFKYTSTAVLGARNIGQLESNIKSMEVVPKLTEEVEARINKILNNPPEARIDHKTFIARKGLRP